MWKIFSSMATLKEIKQNSLQKNDFSDQPQTFDEQIEETTEEENKFEYTDIFQQYTATIGTSCSSLTQVEMYYPKVYNWCQKYQLFYNR
jgi:hypothetical protein